MIEREGQQGLMLQLKFSKLRGERSREQREGDVGTGHAGRLMVGAAAAMAAESS